MARDLSKGVGPSHFTGVRNVFGKGDDGGSLAGVVREHLRHSACVKIAAAAPAALTDSSGQTAGANLLAITVPVSVSIAGGTTGILNTSLDTSLLTISAAYKELRTKVNQITALVGGGTFDVGTGAAANDIIEAIDVSVAANTTDNDSASFVAWRAAFNTLLDHQIRVAISIDDVRARVGLAPMAKATPTQGTIDNDLSLVAYDTTIDAIAGGLTSVTKTATDAILVLFGKNINLMATNLNAVRAITPGALTAGRIN